MKITQEVPEFKPVRIVLETYAETEELLGVISIALAQIKYDDKRRASGQTLYNQLHRIVFQ